MLPEAPTPLLGHGGRGVQKKGTQVSFSPHYLPAKVARPLSPRVHTCDMEVKGLSHRVAVKTGDEAGKEVGCDQDRGRWEAACHVSELARGCKEKQRGSEHLPTRPPASWGIRSITSLICVLAVAEEA